MDGCCRSTVHFQRDRLARHMDRLIRSFLDVEHLPRCVVFTVTPPAQELHLLRQLRLGLDPEGQLKSAQNRSEPDTEPAQEGQVRDVLALALSEVSRLAETLKPPDSQIGRELAADFVAQPYVDG